MWARTLTTLRRSWPKSRIKCVDTIGAIEYTLCRYYPIYQNENILLKNAHIGGNKRADFTDFCDQIALGATSVYIWPVYILYIFIIIKSAMYLFLSCGFYAHSCRVKYCTVQCTVQYIGATNERSYETVRYSTVYPTIYPTLQSIVLYCKYAACKVLSETLRSQKALSFSLSILCRASKVGAAARRGGFSRHISRRRKV